MWYGGPVDLSKKYMTIVTCEYINQIIYQGWHCSWQVGVLIEIVTDLVIAAQ